MASFSIDSRNSIWYEHTPPTADTGATFVFFNALSGSLEMWQAEIAPALHAVGHGTLLYNMRGQTGSAFTDASAMHPSAVVDDAVALMKHVEPLNHIYVGLSIGGLFAVNAHLGGAPARGILTLNTMRVDGARLEWINTAVTRAAELGGSALVMDLFAPMLFDEPWLAANRDNALNPSQQVPFDKTSGVFGLLSHGGDARWDVPWERVDVPVTVVTGLKDRLFYTEADVAAICARLPSAERVDVSDAGHMVPLEQPQKVIDALLALRRRI
jgi:pimeloyl-ACP methyl ester carboxylesterase